MKTIVSTIFATVFAGTAYASDLPRRTAPLAPVAPVATVASLPFFVGLHVGATGVNDGLDKPYIVNLRAGYEFSPYARVEASYDYAGNNGVHYHTGSVNGIAQYRFGTITPYALVGVGYRWSDFKNEPVYTVGGGVRYEFMRDVELDARYRYVTDRDRVRDDNIFTLGVNFKF